VDSYSHLPNNIGTLGYAHPNAYGGHSLTALIWIKSPVLTRRLGIFRFTMRFGKTIVPDTRVRRSRFRHKSASRIKPVKVKNGAAGDPRRIFAFMQRRGNARHYRCRNGSHVIHGRTVNMAGGNRDNSAGMLEHPLQSRADRLYRSRLQAGSIFAPSTG
jgi:hypothetical protein